YRLVARRRAEQPVEVAKGPDAGQRGEVRRVLERVGDPEQEIRDRHFPARRFRQRRDRQSERPARSFQQVEEISHGGMLREDLDDERPFRGRTPLKYHPRSGCPSRPWRNTSAEGPP